MRIVSNLSPLTTHLYSDFVAELSQSVFDCEQGVAVGVVDGECSGEDDFDEFGGDTYSVLWGECVEVFPDECLCGFRVGAGVV